jgi:hypothetical protein
MRVSVAPPRGATAPEARGAAAGDATKAAEAARGCI